MAALNKEACILMLPALCFFKIWSLSRHCKSITFKQAFIKNKAIAVLMLSIFIGLILFIKLGNVTGPGYARIDGYTLSSENLLNSIKTNIILIGIAFLVNIIYLARYKESESKGFYLFVCLVIIPQLILYNKTGMYAHYILPASIGFSWLIFYPLSRIDKQYYNTNSASPTALASHPQAWERGWGWRIGLSGFSNLIWYKILIIIVILVIFIQIRFTRNHAYGVANDLGVVQSAITNISACVDRNKSLAIVANPYFSYEMTAAFKSLSERVIKTDKIYLATYGSHNSYIKIDAMQKDEQKSHFINPSELENLYQNMTVSSLTIKERRDIKGVVILSASKVENILQGLNLDWLKEDSFTRKSFSPLDLSIYCRK
jgi:hypothetical protein